MLRIHRPQYLDPPRPPARRHHRHNNWSAHRQTDLTPAPTSRRNDDSIPYQAEPAPPSRAANANTGRSSRTRIQTPPFAATCPIIPPGRPSSASSSAGQCHPHISRETATISRRWAGLGLRGSVRCSVQGLAPRLGSRMAVSPTGVPMGRGAGRGAGCAGRGRRPDAGEPGRAGRMLRRSGRFVRL